MNDPTERQSGDTSMSTVSKIVDVVGVLDFVRRDYVRYPLSEILIIFT